MQAYHGLTGAPAIAATLTRCAHVPKGIRTPRSRKWHACPLTQVAGSGGVPHVACISPQEHANENIPQRLPGAGSACKYHDGGADTVIVMMVLRTHVVGFSAGL